MPRIYTEIRITHETIEAKKEFEQDMGELIKKQRYRDRADWIYGLVQNHIIDKAAKEYSKLKREGNHR
jgi:hypothetical protein